MAIELSFYDFSSTSRNFGANVNHAAKSCCILRSFSDFYALSQNCEKRLLAVWQSSCPHGTSRLPLEGFSLNLVFEYLSKIC
jgi:hypothetical protein